MRLIDADRLFDATVNRYMSDKAFKIIKEGLKHFPTVNTQSIIHSRWEAEADGYADGSLVYDMWYCSNCGKYPDELQENTDHPSWKYCPYCGAKMDSRGENDT